MDLKEVQTPPILLQDKKSHEKYSNQENLTLSDGSINEINQNHFSIPLSITQFKSINESMNYSSHFNDSNQNHSSLGDIESNMIPEASRRAYEKAYTSFLEWKSNNHQNTEIEESLFYYISDLLESGYAPTTLYCTISKLRRVIYVKENIKINVDKIESLLKEKEKEFTIKKSEIFTREEFERFLREAPDEEYLLHKMFIIFGIYGVMRGTELINMRLNDILIRDDEIEVCVPESKNSKRTFIITKHVDPSLDAISLVKKYISLRPSIVKDNRFMIYMSNGKCVNRPVGRNRISKITKDIAEYLGFDKKRVERFSGYAYKKTGTYLLELANAQNSHDKKRSLSKLMVLGCDIPYNSPSKTPKINDT